MTTATLPPGPKGRFFGGNLEELRRDPLGLYTRCAREFGDFTTMRFGLRRVYLINHPDLIEQVLVGNARNFIKHYALKMNRLLLGDGLLTSEGDFWLRQRRLLQPLFHRDRLAGYGAVMVELAERLAASWRDGETRDLLADMTRLTLEIIARTLFGTGLPDKAQEIGGALAEVGRVVQSPPGQLPRPAGKRADAGQPPDAAGGAAAGRHPLRPHQAAARRTAATTICSRSCCTPATRTGP